MVKRPDGHADNVEMGRLSDPRFDELFDSLPIRRTEIKS